MQHTVTSRGFVRIEFTDIFGSECSLQESSLAIAAAIWLGVSDNRMHLDQDLAAMLIPLLQHFVEYGTLPSPHNENGENTPDDSDA